MNEVLSKVRPKISKNVVLDKIPGRGELGKSRKAKINANTESIYEPKYDLIYTRPSCVKLQKNLLGSTSELMLMSSSAGMKAR